MFEQPLQEKQSQEQMYAPQGQEKLRASRWTFMRDQHRTWHNLAYLLLAFPLGLFYFMFLAIGITLSLGMIIVWIGLPLLFLTLTAWWYFAKFERNLTINLLHVSIPPMTTFPANEHLSFRQVLNERLRNPVTWKSLIYLLLKFPFGIFAFSLIMALFCTSLTLILSPLVYAFLTSLYNAGAIPHLHPLMINFGFWSVPIDGVFRVTELPVLLAATATGLVLGFISRYIVNWVAGLWGLFAQLTLGRNEPGPYPYPDHSANRF